MKKAMFASFCLLFLVSGWGAWAQSKTLTVYCPHPLDFIKPLVSQFEAETGIKVEVVAAGTGELLKRIQAEARNPLGDVIWGGTQSSHDNYRQYYQSYKSVNDAMFVKEYIDPARDFTPFTLIPTILMYNKNLVKPADAPKSWADLLAPKWKGKIAFANPSASSSSFAALINMLYAMGKGVPDNGWTYVKNLIANLDGKLLGGSGAVYKGVADGEYPVGITFEEPGARYLRQGAPVGVVYPAEGTVVEADGVAIIKGAKNLDNAKKFVDFITGKQAQTKIVKDLDRRSARTDVAGAAGLLEFKALPILVIDNAWESANEAKVKEKFKELLIE